MLTFTSLTVENFGPFKGTQTIDFTNENGVTIIWGNNGRGKTTLLNIFRYALFGRYKNRRGTEVDFTTLPNIEGRAEGKYDFKVILKMMNNNTKYELTRQCKVRQGVAVPKSNDDYESYVFLKENGSVLAPDTRNHVLKAIMPDEVSRFFLFDGELLQEYEELLLEGTEIGGKIKESIEKILGVPVLTNSAIDSQAILDEYRKDKNKIAQSNAQTQKIATQMEGLEAEKREQTTELERLQGELSGQLEERSRLEGDLQQSEHVKSLMDKMDNLKEDIKQKKSNRDTILAQIVMQTRDAWRGLVSYRVESILKVVDSELIELENKAAAHAIEKRLVEDMKQAAQNHHCQLCDQDVDEHHVQTLLDRINAYTRGVSGLNSEEQGQLQTLRIRRATLESMRASSKAEMLSLLETQLDKLNVEIDDSERQLKAVREELERHGDVEELANSTKIAVNALAQCLKKIENLKEGIQLTKNKLKEIENALSTLEDKLNRVSTDIDMLKAGKKVIFCEQIYDVFEKGIAAYRDKLKTDVEKDATELFVGISNDPDYVQLIINENYGLSMVHVSGEIVPLRSAGFEHVVALSLIGALHKNAPLRGPIIMDSPFGRLDPDHKRNITRSLPNMSEQIVLLAYTHEIDEQQARKTLADALKKEYRLTRRSSFYTEIEVQ